MKKIISFLSYHNAVPIAGVVLALGASAAFAATEGAIPLPPLALFPAATSSTPAQGEPAPDVSYLLSADLDSWQPSAQITAVTEDSDNYYVAYALSTIGLVANAWQPETEDATMTIPKAQLGAYQDLGLYAADQLRQRSAQELAYLQRVQQVARDADSGTRVASAYASLIGKTLDADSAALPGYAPVVQNPAADIASAAQSAPPQSPQPQSQSTQTQPPAQAIAQQQTAAPAATSSDSDDQASNGQGESSIPPSQATTTAASTPEASADEFSGAQDASSTPGDLPGDPSTASSTPPSEAVPQEASTTPDASAS